MPSPPRINIEIYLIAVLVRMHKVSINTLVYIWRSQYEMGFCGMLARFFLICTHTNFYSRHLGISRIELLYTRPNEINLIVLQKCTRDLWFSTARISLFFSITLDIEFIHATFCSVLFISRRRDASRRFLMNVSLSLSLSSSFFIRDSSGKVSRGIKMRQSNGVDWARWER